MKISFDLDDTIIPGLKVFQTERQTFFQKLLKLELVRAGTVLLFKELKAQGHVIGIYTTSYRSRAKIKLLFLLNGFRLDFVINQEQNLRELKDRNVPSSKYPPAFNIDVHVDDSRGVEMEGRQHGFRTVIVEGGGASWPAPVLSELARMQSYYKSSKYL